MRTKAPVPECVPVRVVFLVGFMGAGKTSVGRSLGRQLGWPFEDLDDRVQAREGRTIEAIFRESGEAAFRKAEHTALLDLLAGLSNSPQIIALGGGAFAQPENAALLTDGGVTTVFLDGPVEELFRRCQAQKLERPLRSDTDNFRKLYETRRPHYLKASLRIETNGKDVETIATEVADALGIRAAQP
jgi:shikimate kinase